MNERLLSDKAISTGKGWDDASLGDLKAERTETLRRVEEAERQRDEALRLAEIYSQAYKGLVAKAERVQAESQAYRDSGDAGAGRERLEEAGIATTIAEKSARMADEKSQIARAMDRTAKESQSLALSLAARIKKIASPWDDWEL